MTRLLLAVCLLATAACTASPPGAHRIYARVVEVHGTARLDGQPFDSDFVGAAVLAHGLMTPCQAELRPVKDGRYSTPVLSDEAGRGCGRSGSRIVLWTYATDRIVYSTSTVPWPATADRVAFDPTYDSSSPNGAAPETAQFHGAVYDHDGKLMPLGTEVETFVGGVRCGMASVRKSDEFVGYVMAVVGPDAVPGCTRDVTLTFKVGGKPATSNPVANHPPGVQDAVDLRL